MSELILFTADYLGMPATDLHDDTDLQTDLGLSSFDLMDLSCELEEHFKIKIETEKLSQVHCIGELKALVG